VAGVYEVVHVFVVRGDDVLRAAVTPRMLLLAEYVNTDVELLESAMGVAGDGAVFMVGSEECPVEGALRSCLWPRECCSLIRCF
jgi:hypothetical protein